MGAAAGTWLGAAGFRGYFGGCRRPVAPGVPKKCEFARVPGCDLHNYRYTIEKLGEGSSSVPRFKPVSAVPRSKSQHSLMHNVPQRVCEYSQERLRWRGTLTVLRSNRASKPTPGPGAPSR